jgi:tRNA/rRNA methyltransferase
MRPSDCVVILVRPSRPGNLGATCRAMKNMGFTDLVLVDPPPGLRGEEAHAQAWQAWDVLETAREAPTLRAAVKDCSLVVGTSGKADGEPPRRLAEQGDRGRVALVFGPESTGLRREELAMCHVVCRIPASCAQPSLNLAQAVLILTYEIFVSGVPQDSSSTEKASSGEIEEVLESLSGGLLGIGFLNPENPTGVLGELRGLLVRAKATPRDLQLLRGLARQTRWAGAEISRMREPKG